MTHICLVGHVMVDVTNISDAGSIKMRLGGVMHAARMLWAMGCPFSIAYAAPAYLEDAIKEFALHHGAESAVCIGVVSGSPNVILVRDALEVGDQGYELLLRDNVLVKWDLEVLSAHVQDVNASDVMLFPNAEESFDLLESLKNVSARIYLDANDPHFTLDKIATSKVKLESLFVSTSSALFLSRWTMDPMLARQEVVPAIAKSLLVKENRGGSRFWDNNGLEISTPAQSRIIKHSIGVGDCFDSSFIHLRRTFADQIALSYAASLAAEYAATTFPEDFKQSVHGILQIPESEIEQLSGVTLPWENRRKINIYVAAPDYDYVDTREIDRVEACLRYHNFTPRRPVVENGQMGMNSTKSQRRTLFQADMELLSECQIVFAIILFNDPGTLIEIGMACERGLPVIVYDPLRQCSNIMLTELPDCVTSSLDEAISSVFAFSVGELP